MPARALLVIALIVSLLFSLQAPIATVSHRRGTMPGCGMTMCVTGCCAHKPCCARSAVDQRLPEQELAPTQASLDLATSGLRGFLVVYALPSVERRFGPREEARPAHTLPRLMATCIQLI